MSDWLAIGDETGNWDELHNPGAFLGVALVMGRILKIGRGLCKRRSTGSISRSGCKRRPDTCHPPTENPAAIT